ncbi:hypothetical protein NT04LS_3332, partial [Listeria seeligeri FSL S4-171]
NFGVIDLHDLVVTISEFTEETVATICHLEVVDAAKSGIVE